MKVSTKTIDHAGFTAEEWEEYQKCQKEYCQTMLKVFDARWESARGMDSEEITVKIPQSLVLLLQTTAIADGRNMADLDVYFTLAVRDWLERRV